MVQILLNSSVSWQHHPKFSSYAGKLYLLPNLLEEVGNTYQNVHYSFPLVRLLWLSHPVIEIVWLNCCTQRRVNAGVIADVLCPSHLQIHLYCYNTHPYSGRAEMTSYSTRTKNKALYLFRCHQEGSAVELSFISETELWVVIWWNWPQ